MSKFESGFLRKKVVCSMLLFLLVGITAWCSWCYQHLHLAASLPKYEVTRRNTRKSERTLNYCSGLWFLEKEVCAFVGVGVGTRSVWLACVYTQVLVL